MGPNGVYIIFKNNVHLEIDKNQPKLNMDTTEKQDHKGRSEATEPVEAFILTLF